MVGRNVGAIRPRVEERNLPVWKQLAERKGALLKLLFLVPGNLDRPVQELAGRLLYARETAIGISLDQSMPMGLSRKTRFAVEVLVDGAMLLFQSQAVEDAVFGGGMLILAVPKRIEKVQRRKFARAPLSVNVKVFSGGRELGSGYTRDVSAGGISFYSKLSLEYGQTLSLFFRAPDGEGFDNLPGRIVRIDADGKMPCYAVRFDELPDFTESSLMKVVLKIQMLMRQK